MDMTAYLYISRKELRSLEEDDRRVAMYLPSQGGSTRNWNGSSILLGALARGPIGSAYTADPSH